jgi:hypothetical protein
MPEIKAMQVLEKKYINLITQYDVPCTRTAVYDDVDSIPFADYALTGADVMVHDFSVHLEPIFSDHGFMLLTVSLS